MFRFCDFTYSGLIDILVQALVAILWDFFKYIDYVSSHSKGFFIGSIVGINIFKFKVFKLVRFVLPLGVLLKIGSLWVEKMKVVGMVWECFGDVGASKSTKHKYINIKMY